MLNRLVVSVLVFLCVNTIVSAQYKFASDPAAFVTDVNTMMANTKNPAAIQAGNEIGSTLNSLSSEQQKMLIETTQKLGKSKKVKAHPGFTDFFSAVTLAKNKNVSTTNLDSIIIITNMLNDKFDSKTLQSYLSTLKLFLSKSSLYESHYNRLRVSGGNFTIKWIEGKSAEVEIEEPEVKQEETSETKSVLDAKEDFFSDWDVPAEQDLGVGTIEDEPEVLAVGYNYPMQPTISGPVIVLSGVNLSFATNSDSSVLKNTDATFMFSNQTLVGKGGTMDWSTAGLSEGEIVAEMREYNFPSKSVRLLSEGAKLSYKAKADSIVEGIFEYKENKSKAEAQYPRFKSFKSDIDVKGLEANIVYKGGLSLAGKRLYSSSVDEGFSMIEIQKDGKPKVRAFSTRFEIGDSLILANFATLTLYIDEDSITHPGTHFKYNKKTSVLRVTKKEGYNYAPFIDSYHQLEIISDVVIWDLNKPEIDFNIQNAKNHIPATFESSEFYHAEKYFKLKGAYRFHPLQVIVAYADKIKKDEFYAGDVSVPLKIELETFKGAMIQLMKLGYVDYNIKSGLIQLRPKARHYTQSSRNRKDYDNITFVSMSPSAVNASMNLETHELYVRGVDKIYISDSLKVNIVPDNKEIKIQKNRNFKFDGIINTENFQFVGKEFEFNYDTFLVHMPKIDQIRLAVVTKKKINRSKDTAATASKSRVLGNELRYSSGTLYINKPNNKSARVKAPQYPIFDANSGASVFFDKKSINGGSYDTTVKFEIPPFRLDSLSSDDPQTIGFNGTFKSGGIFPEFKEKLVVMPDFSLGFVHDVPKDGYQLYGGTGKFYSKVMLDNKGIRGDGEIRYLTTTLWSKDFVYYKDSVKTEGTKVVMKEGTHPEASADVTFPKMKVDSYRLLWLPKLDSMFISNVKAPLAFYDSTANMIGTANLRKTGLLGKGVLFTRGSISESYKMHYEQKKFDARNTKFQIESDDPDKPALLGIDVKLNFDLEKSMAYFSPEVEGFASNSFPYVQYRSSLQKGEWDLKKQIVTLEKPEEADLSKSYFYSTHPEQDSLVYNATKGVYDIPKQVLKISGIPFIGVADAHIYPDSGKVQIEQNAVMTTLQKAVIEVDTVKKYHHLYNGTIDIVSRNKFGGVATYRYVNLGDDTLAIQFQDFRTEPGRKKKEGLHTVATGLVKEDDTLFVGPKILYKGKVTMFAESPFLVFDGYIKLDLKGALSYSEWLKYANDGEDKQVKINLQTAVSDNGVPLSTGIHLDNRTNQMYTSFISKKFTQTDHDFFVAEKNFNYDLDSNEFQVGNPDRFLGKLKQGNNMRYDDSTSLLNYAGKFTFLEVNEKNTNAKLISSGEGYAELEKPDYNFNLLLSFFFNMNSKITTALATNIKSVCEIIPMDTAFSPEQQMADNESLLGKIASIAGQKGLESYKSKKAMGMGSLNGINSDMGKSITFSKVAMKWSPVYKSFYSIGKIELSEILKTGINKSINGFIEIRKTNKGDVINIYLEPTPTHWYFISYGDNRLSCISSNDDLNNVIRSKSKGEMPDRSKFYFVAAEPIEKQKFTHEFKTHYLNETEEQAEQEDIEQEKEMEKEILEEKAPEPKTDDIDINEPEIGTEEKPKQEPVATPEPASKKKKKKKEANYDQYKLPDQDNEPAPEEPEEKPKPTIEDQQQKREDQQKMKDLFK